MSWIANNRILVAASLTASLGFFWLYQKERWADSSFESKGKPVGVVVESSSDVRRMPSGRLLWVPLSSSTPVFERDTIRTGPNATARIQLGPNGTVEMQPDSLIVLDTRDDKLQIHLASGDLFLRGTLSARVGGKKIQATNGQVQITRKNEGEFEIKSEAAASIEIDGQATKLDSGFSFIGSETGELRKARYLLKSKNPVDRAEITIVDGAAAKVTVKADWTQIPDREIQNVFVEVSENRSFSGALRRERLASPVDETSFLLSPGHYFWRVVANDHEKLSPISSFEVLAPEKIFWNSSSQSDLIVRSDGLFANWSWSPLRGDARYKFQILRADQPVYESEEFQQNRWVWAGHTSQPFPIFMSQNTHQDRRYFLVIEARTPNSPMLQLRVPLRVVDQRIPDPPADLLASQLPDSKGLDFSWSTPLGLTIRAFEFRLGRDVKTTRSQQIQIPENEFQKLGAPKVFSVRAQSSQGAWSEWASGEINAGLEPNPVVSIRPIYPTPGTRVVKKREGNVFRWNRVRVQGNEPQSFEIRVVGPSFSTTQSSLGQNVDIELGRPGSYRWQVRPVWKSQGEAPWSQEFSFTLLPPPALQAPRIRLPASTSY
jgi:hypothetical protein